EGAILRTSLSPTPTNVLTSTQALGATGSLTETQPTPVPTAAPAVTGTESITPGVPSGIDPLEVQFGPIYRTLFTGAELKPEALQPESGQLGEPAVAFELTTDAAQKFAAYTAANVGGYLCIVLDNRVQSCPVINSAIPDGRGQITVGAGGSEERNSLLTLLRYGALPVSLTVVQSRTIGPTLGTESINSSLVAGVIGLAAVAVFMVLYYRLPGVIAVLALFLYTLTVFTLFKLVPVTLTLPSIAGFILSIGVAVDANVLIFERMKEELRAGRSLSIAVDVGFERAWSSIRDSNVSTLITCGILFWFGNAFGASIVKGFAITLALGVLVSLFTAIRVTRTLLHLTMDSANFEQRHGWFGV
ncbi:MAG TPA: protein translocase subunit SecD, partial [Anaerolineae bacterium]|nr:protein translocase subunit SecD [Anaerolineae bacterium]